jgi:predicted nucleic acid-binding protein
MKTPVFVDSNLWIYLFLKEKEDKYVVVENLLRKYSKECTITISYQVLNEVAVNLKKKGFSEGKIRTIIETMEEAAIIVDFSKDILINASKLREKHSFSFWDSLVVSCSIAGNCEILFSEDMQDGRKIEGLHIENPFKSK